MSHYKPYPAYRPSGVEWIGDVPCHWSVQPFKHQIERNDGGVWGEDPDGVKDTVVLRSTEQTVDGHWKLDDPAYRKLNDVEIIGSLLVENDLLLTKSSGSSLHIGKTTLVSAEIAAMHCCYSNFMQRVRMKSTFLPRLAWYVMNSDLARLQFDLLSNSTTGLANLNATMVGQILVSTPPTAEQLQITDCIDHETKRIDSLITKKTRFIELLKEKRQALITHAVTKGLDPDVKMMDSGVDWIGAVPKSWTFQPIKFLARIGNGSTPTKDNNTYWENGHFPWLTSSCVNQDVVNCADQFVTDAALRECHLPVIAPPAVLIGITGQGKTRGMASTLVIEATINQHIAYLKPKPQVLLIEFLRMFLDASYGWLRFESEGVGSTKGAITCEQLGNTKMPLPPIDEQHHILDQVRQKLSRIDRLSEKTKSSIDLLKERRSAFITAAVTGQIDLREAA